MKVIVIGSSCQVIKKIKTIIANAIIKFNTENTVLIIYLSLLDNLTIVTWKNTNFIHSSIKIKIHLFHIPGKTVTSTIKEVNLLLIDHWNS